MVAEKHRSPEVGIVRLRADRSAPGGDTYLQLTGVQNRIEEEVDGQWERHELSEMKDVEFQHQLRARAGGEHRFLIGGGYRQVDVSHYVLEGGKQDFTVSNVFVLDEWRPAAAWLVSGGVKWESSSITDPTYPWRLAVLWLTNPRNSFRFGVSTAYRSPTLLEE